MKARELREYVAARRYTLLLAALRAARGRLLDELTMMLIKFSGKIVWRSETYAEETQVEHRDQTDMLIATLGELLTILGSAGEPATKLAQEEAVVTNRGGCAALLKACEAHAKASKARWQPGVLALPKRTPAAGSSVAAEGCARLGRESTQSRA